MADQTGRSNGNLCHSLTHAVTCLQGLVASTRQHYDRVIGLPALLLPAGSQQTSNGPLPDEAIQGEHCRV